MKVGYIGLGAMGSSLAQHLVADHELTVYDINRANCAALERMGAAVAASPQELAKVCEVVVLCLPRSSDVEELLFGRMGMSDALRPGMLVIDQTSGAPHQTAVFATCLGERGVLFMDAPVSGGVPAAQRRSITVLASGPDAAWERGAPVLASLSSKVLRCGTRVGDGQALKLITNGLGACYRFATLELAGLWRRFDLPLSDLVAGLNDGRGANFTSRNMLVGIAEGRSTTNFSMALMVKDLDGGLRLGAQTDRAMPLTVAARALMQSTIGLFGPDARLDDVIPFVERLSAVNFGTPQARPLELPPGLSPSGLLDLLSGAAAACNVAAVVEGVRVGLKLGLNLEDIAAVIEAGSAWCRAAAPLLAAMGEARLNLSRDYVSNEKALAAAVDLAAQASLPFTLPGLALARWREGLR